MRLYEKYTISRLLHLMYQCNKNQTATLTSRATDEEIEKLSEEVSSEQRFYFTSIGDFK